MPYGDPPPMSWNDCFGYLPWWALAQSQERLGEPFERVLFDNLWDLYERDEKSGLWFWSVVG